MKSYIKNIKIIPMIALFALIIDFTASSLSSQTPTYAVRVTNIRFLGGIGRGPTSSGGDNLPVYLRGYGQPGTSIELTAEMNVSGWGAPMYGDVLFTISFTDTLNTGTFNVTIPSGSHTAIAAIPYTGFTITPGPLLAWSYTATIATGIYVTSSGLPVSISSTSSTAIYWDGGVAPAFTTASVVPISTINSITFSWTPVNTGTDQDFYEYRVYYREQSASNNSPYKLWSGSNDASLRGLSNNPAVIPLNDPVRHFDSTGRKYTTISNLKIAQPYDYMVTAVDVFGNETAHTAPLGTYSTKPLTLEAIISDGITSYSDFSTLAVPTNRTLQEANIKVDIYTVTSTVTPDACNVWFSTVATEPVDMVITASNLPNTAGLGADLDSVAAVRTGPNKWTAYLPTIPSSGKNKIISNGNAVRFIVELKSGSVSSFIDTDSGTDPNNAEWTFYIGNVTNFKPWPTRILNNVITKKDPLAYPSYYLTEDAFVTIKVYDIKGRTVATLMDGSFRRGGENIKENGWSGSNKYNYKVGVGLYYINIKAVSAASGKTILDDFKKVVMAH